ncbi:hypothetical protein SNOG_13997 [Parastagonospora nodorum SN15]|uniref:ATPase synthesis protein 25, mitochondrial n=2 Tax=Phaeosphaeria nodorum (strain SN15 / ATCC MYA-4574 / FGSC 10173) TaxID=321614 RepID=ATP25_PHANO|nr:hypothetical protein SNOG_13997 [Parastagonospora nodorum SN15]Q0U2C0.2 RecName: Full=ATPase synthesis protein 25, mitochondrial; Flags: Precursor [Parastagonospora nodorum SN15]EAT78622.2 hypothetical protein SNOG_13997 [Parastagonospora nodorum SN15]
MAKDRDDPAVEDPEFAFLDDSTKSSTNTAHTEEPISVADTELNTSVAEASVETSSAAAPKSSAVDTSIPWYLRQNPAARDAQKPIEIPDLPPNPPPLLKTILEYISITAGLDDLELLDLRHLDPPPALGPKLIMIIATARSEKHLHVAADGFARFLRREHGLKANAAGLLGRNELKIKLRRKAKRMRMLANVGGAVPEGNLDDGIRTGWICCTLSKIEAHPDDMHLPGDNVDEFVGFRSVNPGVNVVVQMFTEEKRVETDLETLWGGVLKTQRREGTVAEEKLKELDEDVEAQESAEVPLISRQEEETETPASPHASVIWNRVAITFLYNDTDTQHSSRTNKALVTLLADFIMSKSADDYHKDFIELSLKKVLMNQRGHTIRRKKDSEEAIRKADLVELAMA